MLNRCWKRVNDRFNYLTPTKQPVGFGADPGGRRKRLYGDPMTPQVGSSPRKYCPGPRPVELLAFRDLLNPAKIAREISELQVMLLKLAKNKTEQFYLASFPTALPDIRKGIRIKAS